MRWIVFSDEYGVYPTVSLMTKCPAPSRRHKIGGLNFFDYNPVAGTKNLQGYNFQNLGCMGGLKKLCLHHRTQSLRNALYVCNIFHSFIKVLSWDSEYMFLRKRDLENYC
jgi:hypothetical protein